MPADRRPSRYPSRPYAGTGFDPDDAYAGTGFDPGAQTARPDPDPRLADGSAKYDQQPQAVDDPTRTDALRRALATGPGADEGRRRLQGRINAEVAAVVGTTDPELAAMRDEQAAVRRNDHAAASQAHRRRWDALAAEMGDAPLTVPLVGSQELAAFASSGTAHQDAQGVADRRADTRPADADVQNCDTPDPAPVSDPPPVRYVFRVLNGSGWSQPCYWRPNAAGYTSDIVRAGLYQAGAYPPAQRAPDGQLVEMDQRDHHSCELDAIPRLAAEVADLQARMRLLQDLLCRTGAGG